MQSVDKSKYSYLDEFKIVKTLGSGFHAEVKLGMNQKGKLYAIKKYKRETANLKTLEHQLNVMKVLRHQNIVKLIDVRYDSTYKKKDETQYKCWAIILEYVESGQLFDFVAETGKFSDKVSRTYFNQLMNGLYYMHCKGFVHRDIKPQNILLSKDFILKIADFGFSCSWRGKNGSQILHTKLGTQGYMAPQVHMKNYKGIKADIFSAAVILFIMYSGSPPFQRANANDPYYKLIKQKKYSTFWKAHQKNNPTCVFDQNFKDLITRMIAFDPDQRPTIEQIAAHPWIKGPICTVAQIKKQFQLRKRTLDLIVQRRLNDINQQIKDQKIHKNKTTQQTTGQFDQVDYKFRLIYMKELQKSRNLKQIFSKNSDDFVSDENIAYTASLMKYFLQNRKIVLKDQNDVFEGKRFLNMSKFQDKDDSFQVVYELVHQHDTELFQENLQIVIRFWQNFNKNIIISLELMSGNEQYFNIVRDEIGSMFSQN